MCVYVRVLEMLTVVRFEEFLDDRIGKEVMAKVRPKARALMMKEFDEFVRGPPPLPPSLPHGTNRINSRRSNGTFATFLHRMNTLSMV